MNFFAEQEEARRQSFRLVLLFSIAVLVIVLAIDALVVFVGFGGGNSDAPWAFDPWRMAMVSLGVAALIGVASLFRTVSLRSGGSAVARGMGATAVPADTTNPAWRKLRNVIEEVAIASSVPVPEIYVMENEAGINAFAAGYAPEDAAVCVTRGCLDKLTRDELQGVIAHEFSHVLNGDMRVNIRLIGLLFGILVIGILGRFLMYSGGSVRSSRDRGSGASLALIGIALLVIGYVGFFFGRLIQAGVARSRETLADASAVQFTRQTTGIAGALKKIAALAEGSRLEAQDTQEVAHMLFGEGLEAKSWFATHPPLAQRIRALDPAFELDELRAIHAAWQQPRPAADKDDPRASLSGLVPPEVLLATIAAAAAGPVAALPSPTSRVQINVDAVPASVGHPDRADFATAGALHRAIPDALRQQASDPGQAMSLVLALALSHDGDARRDQLASLAGLSFAEQSAGIQQVSEQTRQLNPMMRLPLAALAFPALRRQPRPRLEELTTALNRLMLADQRISLAEYCLAKLVQVQVISALNPAAAFRRPKTRLARCRNEVRALFALVARGGNSDQAEAQRAFQLAIEEVWPGRAMGYELPEDWPRALDQALATLDRLSPSGKQLVVRGLARAISADGTVTLAEAELLRVVCAALHCPLPPLLAQADG